MKQSDESKLAKTDKPANDAVPVTESEAAELTAAVQPKAGSWLRRHRWWVVGGVAVVVVGVGVAAWLGYFGAKKPVATTVHPASSKAPSPSPATKLSPLTGLPVDPAAANRPITSVIIENQTDARPQSGLSSAGVVYEALAEGGITRFQAFFLDQRPATLGPVRSIRTYFVDWGLEYNAPVAHAGGNADALDLIGPLGLKDMNALTSAAASFYRTSDRLAPHNLYTSSDLLDSLEAKLGFNKPATFTPSPRKPDASNANPLHPNIHIDFSYDGYQVDYKYASATNDYARFLANAPHVDRNTGQQIHVKNIVVEYMPTSYGFTRIGEQTVIMQTVGSGQAVVFRDGDAVTGTWSKASHTARTQLTDASGKAIPLDAGNTWYEIVPTGNNVSY